LINIKIYNRYQRRSRHLDCIHGNMEFRGFNTYW